MHVSTLSVDYSMDGINWGMVNACLYVFRLMGNTLLHKDWRVGECLFVLCILIILFYSFIYIYIYIIVSSVDQGLCNAVSIFLRSHLPIQGCV